MSQQINLFNPIFLKQKKYFAAVTMVQALGVILLGCVLMAGYTGWQVKGREDQAAEAAKRLAESKTLLASTATKFAPRPLDPTLDGQVQKADGDVQSMQRVFDALQGGGFGDTHGYSTYFRSFSRQIVDGLWLTGLSINGAGQQIDLKGRTLRAELVPEYLRRLGREPEMKSKSFATLDMQVPLIDPPAPKDGKQPAQGPAQIPAPYIEFDLESLETGKKDAEGKGK